MKFNETPNTNIEKSPEFLGVLSDGQKVLKFDYNHLHDNPVIQKMLPQALERINPVGRSFFIESIDFGETIGVSTRVETKEGDEIIYAQREGREGLTRFVKNREPIPTSFLTVVLKKIPEGYKVITAFIGSKAEREPWDRFIASKEEAERSRIFWQSNALIWGTEKIIPGIEKLEP